VLSDNRYCGDENNNSKIIALAMSITKLYSHKTIITLSIMTTMTILKVMTITTISVSSKIKG